MVGALRDGAGVGVVAAQAAREGAASAAELLVDHGLTEQIAGQTDAGLPERHRHAELGGEAALHVPASPAVEPAATDHSREGAVAPGIGASGHGVHVAGQKEAAAAPGAGETRDQVVAPLVVTVASHVGMARALEEATVVHLDVQAIRLEEGEERLLGRRLVPVRRHGDAVHAHEGLGEADDLGLQGAEDAAGVADGGGGTGHPLGSSEMAAERLGEGEAVLMREG